MSKPRCFIVLLVIAWVTLGTISAQDATPAPTYQLRTPTATDYMTALPDVLERWTNQLPEYFGKVSNSLIINSVMDDAHRHFTDAELIEQPFNVLSGAYASLSTYAGIYVNLDGWTERLLETWLRENPTDLSKLDRLDLASRGVNVSVDSMDFNADGIDEYILSVSGVESGELVLQRDLSTSEGYRVAYRSLHGWLPGTFHISRDTEHFQDINADGQPEWFITTRTSYSGVYGHCLHLRLLSWRGDTLIDILDRNAGYDCPDLYRGDFGLEIGNRDDDKALELSFMIYISDNWACSWMDTSLVDWDGNFYILSSREETQPFTLGCAMHAAEPSMWANNGAKAIPVLENGLATGWGSEFDPERATFYAEVEQYARFRLAMGYELSGQNHRADQLFDELRAERPQSDLMNQIIRAVTDAEPNPLSRCIAVYNVFAYYERATFFSSTLPTHMLLGRIRRFGGMAEDSPPPAERAGCNAPLLINGILNEPFSTRDNPMLELRDRSLAIDHALSTDLNEDGQSEWLIWLDAQVEPLFFAPHGDTYIVSRPHVRRPNDYTQIRWRQFPSAVGGVLVDWAYLDFPYVQNQQFSEYQISGGYCLNEIDQSPLLTANGNIVLWQLQNDTLIPLLNTPLCKRRDVALLFHDDGRELHAAAVRYEGVYQHDDRYLDAIWVWDADKQTYVPPPPELRVDPAYNDALPEPPITDAYVFDALLRARDLFAARDYAGSLAELETTLQNADPSVDPLILNGAHYWRALNLEALGRLDEALAAYVMVYESAPDSAWGILAAMHLLRDDVRIQRDS